MVTVYIHVLFNPTMLDPILQQTHDDSFPHNLCRSCATLSIWIHAALKWYERMEQLKIFHTASVSLVLLRWLILNGQKAIKQNGCNTVPSKSTVSSCTYFRVKTCKVTDIAFKDKFYCLRSSYQPIKHTVVGLTFTMIWSPEARLYILGISKKSWVAGSWPFKQSISNLLLCTRELVEKLEIGFVFMSTIWFFCSFFFLNFCFNT